MNEVASRVGPMMIATVGAFLLLSEIAAAQAQDGWLTDSPPAFVPEQPVSSTVTAAATELSVEPPQDQRATATSTETIALAAHTATDAADAVSAEIAALVRGVTNGPDNYVAWAKCFFWVVKNIEYEHYYGAKKGARLTLLERRGNDADVATLLVAMLRAANYEARYGFGVVGFATEGAATGYAQDWLGIPVEKFGTFNAQRGFPRSLRQTHYRALDRVWVEVNINGAWGRLDPAVKRRVRIVPPISTAAVAGYDRAALKEAGGGMLESSSIEALDEAALGSYLASRTRALLTHIDENHHGTDAADLLGGWREEPFLGPDGLPDRFVGDVWDAFEAPQSFASLPDSLLSQLAIEVRSTASDAPVVASFRVPLAQLRGRRLSLTFSAADASGRAQLWLDDALVAEESAAAVGSGVKVRISIDHPHANSLSPTLHDQTSEKTYSRGSRYALTYSFNPSSELLRTRQEQLDAYRRAGFAESSREVVTETLNVIGLTWLHQAELMDRVIGAATSCDTTYFHRMGRVGQENGYFIDLDLIYSGIYALDGNGTIDNQATQALIYFASAMEHGVIEQLQGSSNASVSTVKLLRLGNQQPAGSRKIFHATPQTWSGIQPQLQGYSTVDLNKIAATINAGGEVLLPQKGNITLNQWTGAGFITRVTTGSVTATGMAISGNLNGGYGSKKGTINPAALSTRANANPAHANSTKAYIVPAPVSEDPIDLASGDYVFPATDLEVGAAAPRGFKFSRQYHGGRRWVNPAGLGYGWTHNWHVRATRRSAYEPALGVGGTPYDVAAAIVAAHVALDLSSAPADAQHWTLASLVAHWFTDQLQDNALGISIGERSLQFVRRADGVWQPPGGVTMTLAPNGSGWKAQERHGNTYHFDPAGRLASIVDQGGKTLNVAYNADDRVATVTDAYARALTFHYTGTQLTAVNDNAGRSVGFAYTNANDLHIITDPEGKKDRFDYDAEHRISEIRNHDEAVIATNTYDAAGDLVEQRSHGLAERTWKYFYEPACSLEENPKGGRTFFFFDHRRRQIAQRDAAGRRSTLKYDGQDRLLETLTPLGRKTTQVFDRFHNLIRVTDPDNKTTKNGYDDQHRLTRITDPLNHETTFTYNAQHQPLTITNAENETMTHTYNASGTLASTAAPGSAPETYGYNERDERTTTEFPGGGTETIVRNVLGDATSVTDARRNVTASTYNARRQVLTITRPGPVPVVTTHTYDNQRHLASTIDARGNETKYTYSPTGKLLRTDLPGDGSIVDEYDTRDWRVSTTNGAGEKTTFQYFATGELSHQRDALTRTTYFGYDADSRRVQIADALGHLITTKYNGRDLVSSVVDQLGEESVNDHDDAGRRTAFTNRRKHSYAFGYDDANRLLSTTTPKGRISAQSWDDKGLLGTLSEPNGETTTLTYEARRRVSKRTDDAGEIGYTYDANGNMLTVTEGNVVITRTYDELNRVASYDDGRGHAFEYKHDGNGNLTELTYEPGKTVTYSYDARNRLTSVTDWTGRVTTLDYDGADRLLRITRPNGTVRTNTWDGAGQLIAVDDRNAVTGLPVVALRMRYDSAGRLTQKLQLPGGAQGAALPDRNGSYNDDNQLATLNGQPVTHDKDGNVTDAPTPNDLRQTGTYGWNARNQLTTAPGDQAFAYDAEGLRIGRTHAGQTTTFVFDPHGPLSRLLWQIRPDGSRTFYVYGPVLLYEIEEQGNVARHYHYDHLASTIALTSDSGETTARVSYSAYGVVTHSEGELNTPFLWQGSLGVQTDPNGLHHMRARYYHAQLGRFLSEDPLGLAAGPNVYMYADGNPVMFTDPSGQFSIREVNWRTLGMGALQVAAGYGNAIGGTYVSGRGVGRTSMLSQGAAALGIADNFNESIKEAQAGFLNISGAFSGKAPVFGEDQIGPFDELFNRPGIRQAVDASRIYSIARSAKDVGQLLSDPKEAARFERQLRAILTDKGRFSFRISGVSTMQSIQEFVIDSKDDIGDVLDRYRSKSRNGK